MENVPFDLRPGKYGKLFATAETLPANEAIIVRAVGRDNRELLRVYAAAHYEIKNDARLAGLTVHQKGSQLFIFRK